MKRAIFFGPLNPLTNRELDVIEKSFTMFDEIIVAVDMDYDINSEFDMHKMIFAMKAYFTRKDFTNKVLFAPLYDESADRETLIKIAEKAGLKDFLLNTHHMICSMTGTDFSSAHKLVDKYGKKYQLEPVYINTVFREDANYVTKLFHDITNHGELRFAIEKLVPKEVEEIIVAERKSRNNENMERTKRTEKLINIWVTETGSEDVIYEKYMTTPIDVDEPVDNREIFTNPAIFSPTLLLTLIDQFMSEMRFGEPYSFKYDGDTIDMITKLHSDLMNEFVPKFSPESSGYRERTFKLPLHSEHGDDEYLKVTARTLRSGYEIILEDTESHNAESGWGLGCIDCTVSAFEHDLPEELLPYNDREYLKYYGYEAPDNYPILEPVDRFSILTSHPYNQIKAFKNRFPFIDLSYRPRDQWEQPSVEESNDDDLVRRLESLINGR